MSIGPVTDPNMLGSDVEWENAFLDYVPAPHNPHWACDTRTSGPCPTGYHPTGDLYVSESPDQIPSTRRPAVDDDGNLIPMRHWTLTFTLGPETYEQEIYCINLADAWDAAFHTVDVVTDGGDDPDSIRLDEHEVI